MYFAHNCDFNRLPFVIHLIINESVAVLLLGILHKLGSGFFPHLTVQVFYNLLFFGVCQTNMDSFKKCDYTQVLGRSLFWAGLQFSIASVLQSSTFSVLNFSKDQETLQGAADALRHYVIVAVVWTVATMLVMYSKHGLCGAVIGFITNLVIVGWLIGLYVHAFGVAAKRNNLKFPSIVGWY